MTEQGMEQGLWRKEISFLSCKNFTPQHILKILY